MLSILNRSLKFCFNTDEVINTANTDKYFSTDQQYVLYSTYCTTNCTICAICTYCICKFLQNVTTLTTTTTTTRTRRTTTTTFKLIDRDARGEKGNSGGFLDFVHFFPTKILIRFYSLQAYDTPKRLLEEPDSLLSKMFTTVHTYK